MFFNISIINILTQNIHKFKIFLIRFEIYEKINNNINISTK